MSDLVKDVVELDRLEQLEALGNPLRVRILMVSDDPIGVAELAERLGVPKTRLYYHVNMLVELGMLNPCGQRKSGARVETLYQMAGRNFRAGSGLFDHIEDPRTAAAAATAVIFDPARAEAEVALERRFAGGEKPMSDLGRGFVRLTPDEAEAFKQRLRDLMEEYGERPSDPSRSTFSFTYSFMPIEDLAGAL